MVGNKEKHQWAFCASAVALCAGLSLIATAITVSCAISPAALVFGFILTVLSFCQAKESYLFLQNNEKPVHKMANNIRNNIYGEPEGKLFIERVFQPFVELLNGQNRAR
ncbi:WD_0736 family protein [Wolbachia endosymbiont of Folsomia candida]|uniref:WD_0736 family protein n=1 Tax=Wolbachia endosymbiont of Folsomia candida TaxID=169402 RepID=UPI000AA72118|nr:hypothetical protein [Wolbachia endosymbiont of Folsomia candida]APR97764.1 hypothetical protein ASM33_00175 [Wolbachia endosymbiont of Folsomia candida]